MAPPRGGRSFLEGGLRGKAIIATLIYTAARVGAVSKLSRDGFYFDGWQHNFRLDEKRGKQRSISARHDLQEYIEQYLALPLGRSPREDSELEGHD